MDTVSPASPPAAIPAAIGTLSRVRRPPTRQTEMKYIYDHCDRDGRAGPPRARGCVRPSVAVRNGPRPSRSRPDDDTTKYQRLLRDGAPSRGKIARCVYARGLVRRGVHSSETLWYR